MDGGTLIEVCNFTCDLWEIRNSLATLELPEELVTEDGLSYITGTKFQQLIQCNGVLHITMLPSSSVEWLAKRTVPTFQSGTKKWTEVALETQLPWFLFHYHTTPHATTGQPPADLSSLLRMIEFFASMQTTCLCIQPVMSHLRKCMIIFQFVLQFMLYTPYQLQLGRVFIVPATPTSYQITLVHIWQLVSYPTPHTRSHYILSGCILFLAKFPLISILPHNNHHL